MELQFFFPRRFSEDTDTVTAYVLQNSQCNDSSWNGTCLFFLCLSSDTCAFSGTTRNFACSSGAKHNAVEALEL